MIIRNYRKFKQIKWNPSSGLNVIVGNNQAGKSTLLEAINLALTGRLNGKWLVDELNPYLFNNQVVSEFFEGNPQETVPPEISIEVFFSKESQPQILRGKVNSLNIDCPGILLRILPDPEYLSDFKQYLSNDVPAILPTEFYTVEWKGFHGQPIRRKPHDIRVANVDSKKLSTFRGMDYRLRSLIENMLSDSERTNISANYRKSVYELTNSLLENVNERIKNEEGNFSGNLKLGMDQSPFSNWDNSIVPQVNDVPFNYSGEGQQLLMKLYLSISDNEENNNYYFIEEPENHLSHTSLYEAITIIQNNLTDSQVFITTHSSYVMNRLGLNNITMIYDGNLANFESLSNETIKFYQKASGFDTLRIVLAKKLVLVEGPSDEMIFNKAYFQVHDRYPLEDGIDVITTGISYKRALELCKALDRPVAVLRDADKRDKSYWEADTSEFLKDGFRQIFVGDKEFGQTLEPQLISANFHELDKFKKIISFDGDANKLDEYMKKNKTSIALNISLSEEKIKIPSYIEEAITFIGEL